MSHSANSYDRRSDDYIEPRKVKKHNKIFCMHTLTAAGACCLFQLVTVTLMLSISGLILDRFRLWEWYELSAAEKLPSTTPGAAIATSFMPGASSVSIYTYHTHWNEAWLEFSMAMHVCFLITWLISILLLALSFRHYRTYMVMPNTIMLVVSLVVTIAAIAGMMVWLLDVSKLYEVDEYEELIVTLGVAFLFFWWLCNWGFLFVNYKYIKYLHYQDEKYPDM